MGKMCYYGADFFPTEKQTLKINKIECRASSIRNILAIWKQIHETSNVGVQARNLIMIKGTST